MEQAEIHTLTSIMEGISEVIINRAWENSRGDSFPQQEEEESIHLTFLSKENLCTILEMELVEILTSCKYLPIQYKRRRNCQ